MPSVLYNPPKAKPEAETNSLNEESNIETKEADGSLKRKSLIEGIREIHAEYCSNTSIHGFQYFGQQRPRKEVIFWIVVIAIAVFSCTSIIGKIYVRWYDTPVIVSFSEKSTPIWSIPFPRVTICPETKRAINKTVDDTFWELSEKLDAFEKGGRQFSENFTHSDLEETLTLMHICSSATSDREPYLKEIDYIRTLNKMLPDFDRYFYICMWFGNETTCGDLFTRVYTDEGICYAFNSLRANDMYHDVVVRNKMRTETSEIYNIAPLNWSLEEGYTDVGELHTYPARVLNSGSTAGLRVFLQSFIDEVDYTCQGPIQGFKVMLHSPDDVPSVSKHFVRISMDKEVIIAVKPKMITTSADIAAYDPAKRRCFMRKDRQLKFYKIYSQNNCERECLTNFTLSQCGCVHFSMPRSADTPICGENKIECYMKAQNELNLKQFKDGLQLAKEGIAPADNCNCMPACTSLEYEAEISEGHFDLVNTLKAYDDLDSYNEEYPGGKMSKLLIYFKENQFITSRRSELYGVTELLANFGGVFGLFMGISILSVVEVIYHFTLRLWSNMTRTIRG